MGNNARHAGNGCGYREHLEISPYRGHERGRVLSVRLGRVSPSLVRTIASRRIWL